MVKLRTYLGFKAEITDILSEVELNCKNYSAREYSYQGLPLLELRYMFDDGAVLQVEASTNPDDELYTMIYMRSFPNARQSFLSGRFNESEELTMKLCRLNDIFAYNLPFSKISLDLSKDVKLNDKEDFWYMNWHVRSKSDYVNAFKQIKEVHECFKF